MEGKDVRRRLVQSTLFPRKESAVKEAENCGGDGETEQAEVEDCGAGKKGRESKMKGNSKSKKGPRAGSKKVIENGKETSSKQVNGSDCPISLNSSFFVKASEKRQQNELVFVDSPEENDEIYSPPSSVENCRSTPQKRKRQDNSTPRKGRRNSTPNKKITSGRRELCSPQIPFDLAAAEQPLRTIPDLRLEAKLIAEENSRIFAGRQIHPFFSSWKGGKTNQDLTESENKGSSFERKEKGFIFKPIHVIEDVEDDQTTLDWRDWIFSESSCIDDLEYGYSPVYEGSVDSLNFDNFLNVSRCSRTSLYQNCHHCSHAPKEVSGELPDKPACLHPITSSSLAEKRLICSDQQKDPDMLPRDTEDVLAASMLPEHKIETIDSGISCGGSFNSEFQEKLLQERITSHYNACHNQPTNCLWTDKYQPPNAKQICGNAESVKFLSEWLHLWHKRGSLTSGSCMTEDNSTLQDADHDYQQSDSDCDGINDEESLKNVLLITGPVGSGKSAAIYACARDQGFQVIEINASDWRNGALVKQKFGEAVESHWLQRTVENGTNSVDKSLSKFFKAANAETHCSDNEVIGLIDLSHEEDSQEGGACPKVSGSGGNRTANYQNEIKTLILFEDVDATLCEDHGFITTIQQLAETAKRPMILTSNSNNPTLPKNLDRLELSFSVPSLKELLGLVHMICASEEAKIHPCLVERFVDYCQRDIRKTIMLLQFWCQGQVLGRGNEFHTTQRPVLFDVDASHGILPKLINWGYPSKLSERVAEEVVKSLVLMEETCGLMNTNSEDWHDYSGETIHVQDVEPDPVEVKKEAMLNLHRALHDDVECAQFEANHELFDFSCSPLAIAGQKDRRRNFSVLSSDSEDSVPLVSAGIDMYAKVVSDGVDVNAEVLDLTNVPISHCLSTDISHHPTGPICHSEADKLEDHYQLLEQIDYSHTEHACKSDDVSLVPESTFVPETEIINETELYSTTVSYCHFFNNASGAKFIIQDQDSLPIFEPVIGEQSGKSLHITHSDQEKLGNNSDTSTACVYEEEVGDSLTKFEADVPRGFLDECSRVDFMKGFKSLNNREADQAIDFVKETWERLHDQCNDLRKYVTAEEISACQALTFAHGMSNVIADADLLLKDCQTLVFDSLESSMVPSEKIHSCSFHDNQLEMSSVLAQHGMCFYAKQIASLGSIIGSTNDLDLASEILSSSASSIALGKLASREQTKVDRPDTKTTKDFNLLTSKKRDSTLSNILQTVVPSRSYLAAKGGAFHEYMSTLSQISRYESSRLSECIDNRKQRRARTRRHYLSSGSFTLLSEEISVLDQYNSVPKYTS